MVKLRAARNAAEIMRGNAFEHLVRPRAALRVCGRRRRGQDREHDKNGSHPMFPWEGNAPDRTFHRAIVTNAASAVKTGFRSIGSAQAVQCGSGELGSDNKMANAG